MTHRRFTARTMLSSFLMMPPDLQDPTGPKPDWPKNSSCRMGLCGVEFGNFGKMSGSVDGQRGRISFFTGCFCFASLVWSNEVGVGFLPDMLGGLVGVDFFEKGIHTMWDRRYFGIGCLTSPTQKKWEELGKMTKRGGLEMDGTGNFFQLWSLGISVTNFRLVYVPLDGVPHWWSGKNRNLGRY